MHKPATASPALTEGRRPNRGCGRGHASLVALCGLVWVVWVWEGGRRGGEGGSAPALAHPRLQLACQSHEPSPPPLPRPPTACPLPPADLATTGSPPKASRFCLDPPAGFACGGRSPRPSPRGCRSRLLLAHERQRCQRNGYLYECSYGASGPCIIMIISIHQVASIRTRTHWAGGRGQSSALGVSGRHSAQACQHAHQLAHGCWHSASAVALGVLVLSLGSRAVARLQPDSVFMGPIACLTSLRMQPLLANLCLAMRRVHVQDSAAPCCVVHMHHTASYGFTRRRV